MKSMDPGYWYGLDALLCLIGGLAMRAASYLQSGQSARATVRIRMMPGGQFILTWYVILAFPLAFANGYLLRLSWIDCIIVGAGTWLCMALSIALTRRFNPVLQFLLFASAGAVWLVVDIFRHL